MTGAGGVAAQMTRLNAPFALEGDEMSGDARAPMAPRDRERLFETCAVGKLESVTVSMEGERAPPSAVISRECR